MPSHSHQGPSLIAVCPFVIAPWVVHTFHILSTPTALGSSSSKSRLGRVVLLQIADIRTWEHWHSCSELLAECPVRNVTHWREDCLRSLLSMLQLYLYLLYPLLVCKEAGAERNEEVKPLTGHGGFWL